MQLNKIYGRFVQNKAGSGAVGRLPSRLLWLCRTFSGGGPGTGVGTPAAPAQPGCPSGGRGRAQGVSPEARPGDPRGPEQTDPHRQRPPRGGPVAGVRVPGDGGGRTSRRQVGTRPTRPRGGGAGDPEREARRAGGGRSPRRPGRPTWAARARFNYAPLPLVGGEERTTRGPPRATTRRAARSAGAGPQTNGRAVAVGLNRRGPKGHGGRGRAPGGGPERTRDPAPRGADRRRSPYLI